jgi:modulator of FtsH protease
MAEAGHWSDFFLAEVGATAALAGFVIVAVSINLQRILEFPQLPGRAGEILIMLVGALLASSAALLPGQPLPVFGWEILMLAAVMTMAPLWLQVRTLITVKNMRVHWWVWRLVIVILVGTPMFAGGTLLVVGDASGVYWVAASVLVTIAATVWNAWVVLVEILR